MSWESQIIIRCDGQLGTCPRTISFAAPFGASPDAIDRVRADLAAKGWIYYPAHPRGDCDLCPTCAVGPNGRSYVGPRLAAEGESGADRDAALRGYSP